MFTIGDFARHGRVSVRMLRHYDATGLLRPAHVAPVSGYRYYTAAQFAHLNQIIALKDLGFTLQQVQDIVDEKVGIEELRGMLRLRRAELETAMAAAAARLIQVEARLRAIESEGHMPTNDVVIKSVPSVRVAEMTATAASFEPEDIGPVIGPLYDELFRRLGSAGITPTGPGVAYYEDAPEGGGRISVHAAVQVSAPLQDGTFRILDLPSLDQAATIVHRGSMDTVLPTAQALARWIDTNDYQSTGHPREVNLECPENRDDWVTELQTPVTRA
ncbi:MULTISPECIES: MerR family transcriptional regulator [Streptomyces]|uniref:MerR family transcriptional regulator n=1 Tax=Streptomyces TaxID=1883 RepID=UPI00055ECAA8|nr:MULTISPECIES: MerR family transcriptional regulator [Streptomyces]MBZ6114238.1 MerR family transcriptional regulator [Streptomyces olivaceus]MBZ6128806.1 MerR family transcriptional regulator [Streptomyces olivaceus]MBZ6148814.1 MerR family transcriptional regulator [Streptomyces olivaceus]MBZ6163465.1 MerR family transcriptional regulator [Streptomyces olivaceus]MBZ6191252.1 MerR family transcriptional regulator [Streptomyces olivaceus]